MCWVRNGGIEPCARAAIGVEKLREWAKLEEEGGLSLCDSKKKMKIEGMRMIVKGR